MKKILILMMLLIASASVFGSGQNEQIEFDPTPTSFEGEWRNSNEKYNDEVYVFTGNKWKYTCNDESKWGSGYFTFTNDAITLYKQDGKKWWYSYSNPKYKITDAYVRINLNDKNWFGFLKQPVQEFVTSGDMFDKIQGTWRFPATEDYIWTFSENHFSYSDSSNSKNNLEGTFELTNNGLLKLIYKEGTALMSYSFTTNESIQIISTLTQYFGIFNKQ
ncbi:MAG: hypothetical protein FWF68_06850 [Spirochaetes bacterium]|nr:hypothetical protein [Brevinematales bacterium]MCL1959303.1 hypothetical protein [Spirochaetota bacterium]